MVDPGDDEVRRRQEIAEQRDPDAIDRGPVAGVGRRSVTLAEELDADGPSECRGGAVPLRLLSGARTVGSKPRFRSKRASAVMPSASTPSSLVIRTRALVPLTGPPPGG